MKVQKWKDLLDVKDQELAAKDKEIARLQQLMSSSKEEQQQDMQNMHDLYQSRLLTKRDYDEFSLISLREAVKERG